MRRYMVELGGVSYDERGYLRGNKWTSFKNATRYRSKDLAVAAFKVSGLDGSGVVYKMDLLNSSVWKCQGTI